MLVISRIIAFCILSLFFQFRSPVLIVTDPSSTLIYGTSRAQTRQIGASLILFRPIIPVLVMENAAPEIIVESVKAAHKAPHAVLFPFHFSDAARRFQDESQGTQVLVLQGRQRLDSQGDLTIVGTDTVTDLYRAGVLAAFLIEEDSGIVVIHDPIFPDSQKIAFEKGLIDGGFAEEANFINSNSDYDSWQDINCVVMANPSNRYFEWNHNIPIILFSWVDPGLTPNNIKIIFDDSPLTLAAESLRLFKKGGGTLPSKIIIPSGRLKGAEGIIRKLSGQGAYTDNSRVE